MRPQLPPFQSDRPTDLASVVCTERLGLLLQATDELAEEIDLGGSTSVEQIAASLLAELRPVLPDVARERAAGQTRFSIALDEMAELLEMAADRGGYWPFRAGDRPPLPCETQVRALVARLRMVARN